MKKLLGILLLASSLTAIADSNNNNLYVGLGAGAGWNNIQNPDAAFRLDGGYNFSDTWAMEIGTTGLTQSGGQPNQSMQYYDLSIKGTLPLNDTYGVFVQLGGAYGSPGATDYGSCFPTSATSAIDYANAQQCLTTDQQAGWNLFTGIGAQYNFTRQVSVNLTNYSYLGANTPQGNSDVLMAGVKFNF